MAQFRPLVAVTAVVLVFALSVSASDLPPRLSVTLEEDAANALRTSGTLPPSVTALDLPAMELRPILPDPPAERAASFRQHGLHTFAELRWDRDATLLTVEEIARRLEGKPGVADVIINEPLVNQVVPNDYEIHDMYGLDQMDLPQGWDRHSPGSANVIIATVDSGCEIYHDDLEDNMWVNAAEDINGNGRFDFGDLNGIDDDGNGFVDDVTGFDFVDWVGLPADSNRIDYEDYQNLDEAVFPDIRGHGTHVAGTTSATTDNGIGVPSASWNSTAMPLRALATTEHERNGDIVLRASGYTIDFIAAITYAVNNGAAIVSNSYGSVSAPNPQFQSTITWARDNNVLILAAAGNDGWYFTTYPAGYDGVVAVGATGPNNVKAGFSNYGSWVDIMAPGVDIWSTMSFNSYHQEYYAAWSGTSMACPNVAAVAGLLLSLNPSLTDDELEQILLASCDNIDDENPDYIGQLGAGRLNARKALLYEDLGGAFAPPQNLNASIVDALGAATLTWDEPAGMTPTSYRVYRDGTYLSSTPDLTFTDAPPIPGEFYHYKVAAEYGAGEFSMPSNEATIYYRDIANGVLHQTFNTGQGNWTVLNNGNADTWGWSQQDPAIFSTPHMLMDPPNWGDTYTYQEYLVSPEFSLEGFDDATLYTRMAYWDAGEFGDYARVQVTADGGNTWQTVQTWDISTGLDIVQVSLSDYAGEPVVQLRYYFHCTQTVSYWWAIDEVLVEGSHDTSIDLAIDPTDTWADETGGQIRFDVTVTNDGVAPWEGLNIWSVVNGPNDYQSGLLEYFTVDLDPSQEVGAAITQNVPGFLENGIYTYWIHAGEFLNEIEISRYFRFVKGEANIWALGHGESEAPVDNWSSSGWAAAGLIGSGERVEASGLEALLPEAFALHAVYPNPFNPTATVSVDLPTASELTVTVYNTAGQEVARLVDGSQPAGQRTFTLDGSSWASGIYFVHAHVPGELDAVRKVSLVK